MFFSFYFSDIGENKRFGIYFDNMGEYDTNRSSYVRNSAFHDGFAAAIGISDTSDGIPIENNVVHHTVDYGITAAGRSNLIRNNLVMLTFWSSTFVKNDYMFNGNYLGAIDVSQAASVVLENNYVAGAERIGINFRGDSCVPSSSVASFDNMTHSIRNNIVVGALGGVVILPDSGFSALELDCVKISSFVVFKSSYWGIYYQGEQRVIVDSNTLVDNQVNVFAMVTGPSILDHTLSNKTYVLQNTLVVGRSSTFDCAKDLKQQNMDVLLASGKADSGSKDVGELYWQIASTIPSFNAQLNMLTGGFVGCVWANFLSGSNGAPKNQW